MKKVELDGEFKLFDTPILKLRGNLLGKIDQKGDMVLSGKINNNGSLSLGDASAIITNNKIQVILNALGAEFPLDASLEGNNLQLHGKTGFNIQIPKITIGPLKLPGPCGHLSLGSFTLDCSMNGSIDLTLGVKGFRAEIKGGFSFNKIDWNVPTLIIEIAPDSLDDLLDIIANFIKSKEKKIFESLLDIDNYMIWLSFVNAKIIEGYDKVTEILSGAYNLSVEKIEEVLKEFPDICISESLHVDGSLPHIDSSLHSNIPPKHISTIKHINKRIHANKYIHADTPHANTHVNT